MWLDRNHTWSLNLSNNELNIILKLLKDEELDDWEERRATEMAGNIEDVRTTKMPNYDPTFNRPNSRDDRERDAVQYAGFLGASSQKKAAAEAEDK